MIAVYGALFDAMGSEKVPAPLAGGVKMEAGPFEPFELIKLLKSICPAGFGKSVNGTK